MNQHHPPEPERPLEFPAESEVSPKSERPAESGQRPPHLQLRYLAAVGIGGAVGAAGRYLLTEATRAFLSAPTVTLIINVVGSLLLGLLLEVLACSGPDTGGRRLIRLLAGTGILGGFTTYSTLALDTQSYLRDGRFGPAVGYAVGTVLLGLLAAAAGILLAGRIHPRRPRPLSGRRAR